MIPVTWVTIPNLVAGCLSVQRHEHTQGVHRNNWVPDFPPQRPLKVTGSYTVQSGTHDFLLAILSNCGPFLYRFQNSGDISRKTHFPLYFRSPPVLSRSLKVLPSEFSNTISAQKTAMKKMLKSFVIDVAVQPLIVITITARHTDRLTDGRGQTDLA